VIILGELANKSSALMVARSVLESISQPIEVDDYSFDISASIGIAIYPDDGSDPAQLRRFGRCRDVSRQAGRRAVNIFSSPPTSVGPSTR
jgi:GGDEF domain-containing protein